MHYFGQKNSELMNVVTLVNVFNCYGSILSMFPTNEIRKNCFLAACKIWDRNIDLDEIDQRFPHGERIGYGNSFGFSLSWIKSFSSTLILHGQFYMILLDL